MTAPNGIIYTRTCAACGISFTTKWPQQIYCFAGCFVVDTQPKDGINNTKHRKYYKPKQRLMRVINCPSCGNEFTATRYNKIYCSLGCQRHEQAKKDHMRQAIRKHIMLNEDNEVIMPTQAVVICNRCGQPFLSWNEKLNKRCSSCSRKVAVIYAGSDEGMLSA